MHKKNVLLLLIACHLLTTSCKVLENRSLFKKALEAKIDEDYWNLNSIGLNQLKIEYNLNFNFTKYFPIYGWARKVEGYSKKENAGNFFVLITFRNKGYAVEKHKLMENKRYWKISKKNPKAILSKTAFFTWKEQNITIEDTFHGPQLLYGYLTIEDERCKEQIKTLVDNIDDYFDQPIKLYGWRNSRCAINLPKEVETLLKKQDN